MTFSIHEYGVPIHASEHVSDLKFRAYYTIGCFNVVATDVASKKHADILLINYRSRMIYTGLFIAVLPISFMLIQKLLSTDKSARKVSE